MRRETAPAPDARSAMGPRSKVGWVSDRFITDRRVPRYGVIDPTKTVQRCVQSRRAVGVGSIRKAHQWSMRARAWGARGRFGCDHHRAIRRYSCRVRLIDLLTNVADGHRCRAMKSATGRSRLRWLGWMFARAEDIDRIIDGCAD